MRVVAPHFVAGIVIDRQTRLCVDAAPILSWCRGRSATDLRRAFDDRGWKAERCEP